MSDAFLEVIKSWLVKRLGYMVDESRPVQLSKGHPASDIDLICMHPDTKKIQVEFLKEQPLSRRLLIESKGWLEYSVKLDLGYDLKTMKEGRVIPRKVTKENYTFVILKEQVFEKGIEIFGTDDFDRVIVVRNITGEVKQAHKKEEIRDLKNKYSLKGVVIIEINEILNDLFKYISDIDEENFKNRKELTENKAQMRKDLVLGVLNLVHWCKNEGERKEIL
jgi:hypothetical protein